MKKKNLVIDRYTQPIYIPNNIYVCKNYTKEDLDKRFSFSDGTSIIDETDDFQGLTCYSVVEKKTGNYCIVILIDKSMFDTKTKIYEAINVICHEAFHGAYRILQYCSVSLDDSSNESYAFMCGWIAECVYKTFIK